jgi:CubicO group peptidase (beta-lactamase class C family)/ATP-dependent Clp protease adapter protein ClpS
MAPVTHGESIAPFIPDLELLIAEAMDEWKIPGLAIAVVQNGELVLVRGYGLRDAEAGLKVTTDTQFMICSITKSFTSTGLALLVDERRLDWKKPVRDYIPEFRLHDAVATDRITVRDLLCHHSGLPRHDWVHMPGDLSPAQMLAAMRYLEPSDDVRSTFQYQNLGYLVAGMVAERVSGHSWLEFTRTRLTDKLQMTVTFSAEDLVAAADAAVPYAMDGDTRLRAKLWPIRTTPAGGINTSIVSFANWLRLHLDKGEFEGQRLVSPTLIQQLQTPRVHVLASEFAEYGDAHYGLGFGVHNYRGERVIGHGGGWIGWGTLMTMMPDRGVGVGVFTNRDGSAVPEILANYVFDRACGKEPISWFDRRREQRRKSVAQLDVDRQARKATRRVNTRPSHDLADYAGEYDHPGYGRMTITHAEGKLQWAYRGMSEPLAHRHYDTFELPEAPGRLLPDRLAISFSADREGNIASLAAPFEPLVKDIVFTRISAGDCTNPAFRRRCIGTFSHGAATVVVGQDNDRHLTLTVGSQPTYKLRPYQSRTFLIDELAGFRVEFLLGPHGEIDELVFHQPNGTFVAQRVVGAQSAGEPKFNIMLFNDDYTPMEFVVWVLEQVFHMNREEAARTMLETHHHGVAFCGVFSRREAENRVKQVMDLARQHQHPLQCGMEAVSTS